MKKTKIFVTAILLFTAISIKAQVAITTDGSSADPSAMLEVKSTTKGFLLPRMIQTERNAIPSPAIGLIIYQTDGSSGLYQYNGTAWEAIGGSSSGSHYIGELHGGGVVFWVDHTGEHGLIVSMVDLSTSQVWSNISNGTIGATAQSDWNGSGNTTAITSQTGHTNSAAKLCADYTNVNYGTGTFSDWYLPSLGELNHLWNNFYEVQKAFDNDGNGSSTAIAKKGYWSSTEYNPTSSTYARSFYFISGAPSFDSKNWTHSVRAVRAF